MWQAPLRSMGRQLRRLVLPLVGYWDLRSLGEEQRASVAALRQSIERISAEQAARDQCLRGPVAELLAKEVDRLDSYLVHHAAALRVEIGNHAAALRAGVDASRLMTDERAAALRNHIEDTARELRAQLDTVRAQIAPVAPETPPLYLAAGLCVILRSRNGYDLIVPCEEEELLTSLVHRGVDAIEPGVRSVIIKRLQPGAVAIDGGANIGLHALTMAAAVGPKGSVTCFEPLPHLAAVLERTLRLNGLAGHTKVERAAISDTVGQALFHAAPHSPLSSLFELPESVSAHSLTVPTLALDSYIPSGGRVDFVKLNIEGAEPHAWRGMQRVLAENPGIEVIVEWSASHFARTGEDPSRFIREIRAAGFTPFVIENASPAGRLIPVDDDHVATLDATNLLLTSQKERERQTGIAS